MKALVGARLGINNNSSTKAFMKAKEPGASAMSFNDLKRMLLGLNIDVNTSIILICIFN